jgi:hypothetical protein
MNFLSKGVLYHGSDVTVRIPDPFFSTVKKDFGQGFYDYQKEKRRLLEDLLEIEASRKLGCQCCFKTPAATSALRYDAKGSYHA